MGLRINTNVPALRALRNLRINDRNQSQSLERLSTGLRINRASDDPSGLIIAEQLRGQIQGLKQAVENSQNASNLISTADSALAEVQTLLVDIKDAIVFAQNTGGSDPAQIAAEQDGVDFAINAIDRIAQTTRFGNRSLLNGTAAFSTASTVSGSILNLRIRSVFYAPGQDLQNFDVEVTTPAERARIDIAAADTAGPTVLRVTGTLGTEDINIASGVGTSGVVTAINSVAGFTGVFATLSGTTARIENDSFGDASVLQIEVVQGGVTNFLGGVSGVKASDRGVDAIVTFEGQIFTAKGLDFNIRTRLANLEFSLASGLATGATASLSIRNTGLQFQLNEQPVASDRLFVGIEGINTALLGSSPVTDLLLERFTGTSGLTRGGAMTTLLTGGDNDLTNNPNNASFIIDRAIDQVGTLRGFLGALQADTLEPNARSLEVEIENLSSSLSDLRDLDFAEETANFTRTQILFQAATAVLASSNLVPQSVLTLLG